MQGMGLLSISAHASGIRQHTSAYAHASGMRASGRGGGGAELVANPELKVISEPPVSFRRVINTGDKNIGRFVRIQLVYEALSY